MPIFFYFLLPLLISSTTTTACDRCLHQSKVVFFSTDSPLSSGACGYGPAATALYGPHLAAAAPALYKSGSGCGACFQVRCKEVKVCSKSGALVMVTDLNKDNNTDFVLSSRAFRAMANRGFDKEILGLGVVNVEYKRVPCEYKGKNLAIRVEEMSKKPYYLAIKILYQGGQTEIVTVVVAQVGSTKWSSMSRNYGAVWDTSRVPTGALQFRLVVTSGFDRKMIWAKSVLPPDWKAGAVYDSGVQIHDIAQEDCATCGDEIWN